MDSETQQCVDNCLRCQSICLSTVMTHCLEVGGEHTKREHFRLMMACVEICHKCAESRRQMAAA